MVTVLFVQVAFGGPRIQQTCNYHVTISGTGLFTLGLRWFDKAFRAVLPVAC